VTEAASIDRPRRPLLAFLASIPIAIVGGLIGLGGAEFRLPVLVGPLGYAARQAVPLNLAVSFFTLVVALLTRAGTLGLGQLAPFATTILAMTAGALLTAWLGPALASRLSNEQLESVILVLLLGIGTMLIIEPFLPFGTAELMPGSLGLLAAFGLGLGIGLVSSLLGVAGGELIIPSLMFGFGAPIKTAGSASLLVSLPTVAVGIVRYARRGAYTDRKALRETVLPMAVGSAIGAGIGGLLVGIVPASAMKLGLGVILIVSALRVFWHRQRREEPGSATRP
jgi:uncharacterized membrane protein YfcA